MHFLNVHNEFWPIKTQRNNRKNQGFNSRVISTQNSNTTTLSVDYFLEQSPGGGGEGAGNIANCVALIHPYISYGLLAWGQTSKVNFNKIFTLQKRAPRLIYFASGREHDIPLFVIRGNILPVDMLYYKAVPTPMYDIQCKTAPTNLIELFTNINSIHSHNT